MVQSILILLEKQIKRIRKIVGAGYIIVPSYILIAIAFVLFDYFNIVPHIGFGSFDSFFKILFILITFIGLCLWFYVVVRTKLIKSVLEDKLVTDGLFSFVRNPMYLGVALSIFGLVCFVTMNIIALSIFPLFWLVTTVVIKKTEEIWLHEKFGSKYDEYCLKVNRFIPIFWKR